MDQYIGKFLDNRYELLEVIGTGGMAVVYKARCHRLNRLVAVKILKSDLAQDAEFRRRFHDESQAVAMLSHPNIVAVYDVSHSDDLDYIVMELIDGITLKQYMQKKGTPLNWREALHFITQIVRALSHAHSRGIIHRDIKPHNIMVLRDGSVKVSDFGIARITSAHQSTLTQEALGSVHYISPEQARGSHIDARSDIYSAGVVLYEMITGRLPFEGDSPVAVAIQHINSIPLSPRELNPDIPEALEEITMKAMAPNADERYLNADAMLTDLEEFRKNPNINFDYNVDDLTPCDEPTRPVPTGSVIRETEEREPRRPVRRREEGDALDQEYDDQRGPIWPILLAVGAILAFIVIIVAVILGSIAGGGSGSGNRIEIPDFQGKTLSELRTNREYMDKFEIIEGELVASETYDAGEVVSQDPAAYTMEELKEGEKVQVTVTISTGNTETMTIPKVENMEYRLAMELLRDRMGLTVNIQRENHDKITTGYAIRTDLPEGTPVKKGDLVNLIVSSGPEMKPVKVIDFTGQKLDRVKTQLTEMELALGEVTDDPIGDKEPGTVTWQSIPVGTTVMAGTVVDLRVASAPVEPSASVEPSPSAPASEPPASEAPVTPPPASQAPLNSKAIFVHLPASAEGKTSVQVRIDVDSHTVYTQTAETALFPISPLVSGRGTQQVSVYVDGELVDQYMETFS